MGGSVKIVLKQSLRKRSIQILLFLSIICAFLFETCLPDQLFSTPSSSIIIDRDGVLLGAKIAKDEQWRFPHSESIPEKFTAALTTYEDKNFFYHPGVDPLAIIRSAYLNIREGKVVSGGSTLSMQLIRLSRRNPKRSYGEKFLEMIIALRLELRYSKKQILALYATHAPFGGNVVGLETAAWRYFGRRADQLSWAETCMLAVLPNNPAMIHPGKNRQKLRTKRDKLLTKLNQLKIIDDLTLKLAMSEALPNKPLPLPNIAPHLLQTLVKRYPKQHRFQSTLDKTMQTTVSDILTEHRHRLEPQGINNAAVLVIDNQSFETVAYLGNSRWSTHLDKGYAVDIVRRPRSTGSILKPLLFAAMIQAGEILPKTLIPDIPTQYNGYMPENYDRLYRGAVPAQVALAKSLNVPAVRMLKRHGVDKFYDYLKNLGLTTLHRVPEQYGLTLILGGAEANLWDLTGIYANLANITRQQSDTSVIYLKKTKLLSKQSTATTRTTQLTPATTWLSLKALLEVNRPGNEGYWKNFGSSRKIAWKTGTSYGLRDAWAIGTTAKYTVGVWVGNADGEGRPGLTGLTAAAPILFDIFNGLPSSSWFARPEWLMRQIVVCKKDGYLSNGYCETEKQWIPNDSNFDRLTPHHHIVHLDQTKTWRVHGRCQSVSKMKHSNWFTLPPAQAYYYRKRHANYRTLPPYRDDCQTIVANTSKRGPIDIVYPNRDTKIYIPIDLAEQKSQTVLHAIHRDQDATLYWHLDEEFKGTTTTFHQLALNIDPGMHLLTIVDQQGNSTKRRFEVLGKERDE